MKKIDGEYPWQGEGVDAIWVDVENNLRILSDNWRWVYDKSKRQWRTPENVNNNEAWTKRNMKKI